MKKRNGVKGLFVCIAAMGILGGSMTMSTAAPIYGDSWITFADDDGFRDSDGWVNPGWGGQAFDAEYLAYKIEGNNLSIGLQTGFNLVNGVVKSGSKNYYAGDLALSFDDTKDTFEYAIDFGFYTEDYDGDLVGGGSSGAGDIAGLYKDVVWNNDIVPAFAASSPFAMESGTLRTGINFSSGVFDNKETGEPLSYFRWVSFDVSFLTGGFQGLDAHWTMSCGNDAIDGHAPVPEPATMLLFGTGLIGLAGVARRRNKKKA